MLRCCLQLWKLRYHMLPRAENLASTSFNVDSANAETRKAEGKITVLFSVTDSLSPEVDKRSKCEPMAHMHQAAHMLLFKFSGYLKTKMSINN